MLTQANSYSNLKTITINEPTVKDNHRLRTLSGNNDQLFLSNYRVSDEENLETDPTDLMLDRCFNIMNSVGSTSTNKKQSEMALTMGPDGGLQAGLSSSKSPSHANGGIPFYELSFNNS